jgi:transcriptional regulator with XRE-family HTH domain
MDKLFKDDWFERMQDDLEGISLGEMLQLQRNMDGLSLTDFKEITGIDRGLCSKYENGRKEPFKSHEEIIISYLGGGYDDYIKAYKLHKKRGVTS